MRKANPARLDAALVLLVAVVKVFCALPNDEANICKVATGKLGPVRTWTRVALPAELDNFSQRRPLGFCHFTTHTHTDRDTHTYTRIHTHTQPHTLAKILFLLMLRRLQRAASACPSQSPPACPSLSPCPPPPQLESVCPSALSTVVCRGENVFYICQINETHTRQSIGKFFCNCLPSSLTLTLCLTLSPFVSPLRFLLFLVTPPTPQEAEIVRVIERTLNETCDGCDWRRLARDAHSGRGRQQEMGGGERGPRSVGMCSTFVVNFT